MGNAIPTLVAPTINQNSVDGAVINLNVSGAFTDPDGDTLTYSATGLPTGLTIDGGTGVISGTIAANASVTGSFAVDVTADDGQGGIVIDSFTWTVTNPAPTVAAAILDQSSADSDIISLDVSGAFSDVDGDTLTYSAIGLPAGLSIGTFTGVIGGTIAANASVTSPYSVDVTVDDG